MFVITLSLGLELGVLHLILSLFEFLDLLLLLIIYLPLLICHYNYISTFYLSTCL